MLGSVGVIGFDIKGALERMTDSRTGHFAICEAVRVRGLGSELSIRATLGGCSKSSLAAVSASSRISAIVRIGFLSSSRTWHGGMASEAWLSLWASESESFSDSSSWIALGIFRPIFLC